MFSSRLFVFFALAAFAAAYPANDDFPKPITTIMETDIEEPSLWFRFPSFGNIFAPLTKLFSNFADIGPRIEADDDKFRIIVNVKDYKKEDLKVKVKNDFILVQGAHEAKQDDHDLFASQFFHTYSLPTNASASDVTAKLTSDGFLVVDAPLNGNEDKNNEVDREVPIVENGETLKKMEKEDKVEKVDEPVPAVVPVEIDESPKVTTELPSTLADVEDERKEPTTPSDREEVTVNDVIPNNEVNEISSANEVQP